MTILKDEIKILASERLTDFNDGGGSITGNEIVDGESNNMHPDVSDLDRTYGRVSIIKVFAAVTSPNTDFFYGANAILPKVPDDPAVSAAIFTTKNWVDERAEARSAVESYLTQGVNTVYRLYGNHIVGQKAVAFMTKPGATLPRIDDVLVLIRDEGTQSEKVQFIKIESLTTEELTFNTQQCGDFKVEVVTCIITEKLLFDFTGESPNCQDEDPQTIIRKSIVADAASYYSTTELVEPISINDVTLKVEDIYTQLVPSAQTENGVSDIIPGGSKIPLIAGSANTVNEQFQVNAVAGNPIYLGTPILPGTLKTASAVYVDNGVGALVSTLSNNEVATINYELGSYTPNSDLSYSGSIDHEFIPAGVDSQISTTRLEPITLSNRALVYVPIMLPIPQAGTLVIQYRAQNNWIELTDRGDGVCVGSDPEFGVATLNFTTGSLTLTLGALPDVGSSIIYSWGQGIRYVASETLVPTASFRVVVNLNTAVEVGSVVMNWENAGSALNATDDGAGNLTGTYVSGIINYDLGIIELDFERLPTFATNLSIDYDKFVTLHETLVSPTNSQGDFVATLSNGNILPNTVVISPNVWYGGSRIQISKDNGSGVFTDGVDTGTPSTINYTTGAIDVKMRYDVQDYTYTYGWY